MTHWMKQWKFISILVIVFFSSCSKSLTVDQENSTVEEGYYQTSQRIQQAVIGGYVDLRRALFANYAWMMYGEARAGDLNVDVAYQQQVVNQELTSTDRNLVQLTDWGYFYDVIKDANDLLDILEKTEEGVLNSYQQNVYKGEALALKSIAYFYLARIWGPVSSAEKTNFGAHLTSQEVVNQAIVWATEAKNLLPWVLLNDDGIENTALTAVRFNKTAATSLLAQEHLWLGNGQGAYDLLTSTFTSNTADSLSGFGLAIGEDRRTDIPLAPLSANIVTMPIAQFNAIYPAGDARRNTLFNVSGNTASLIINDATKVDLLPRTEVGLLSAEAAWRAGHLDEARDFLIAAANGATEDYSTLTDDTFGDALLLERQRLLVGTGQRVFDLIRFGKVDTYISEFTEADVTRGAAYWPLSGKSINGTGWSQNAYWLNP